MTHTASSCNVAAGLQFRLYKKTTVTFNVFNLILCRVLKSRTQVLNHVKYPIIYPSASQEVETFVLKDDSHNLNFFVLKQRSSSFDLKEEV